MAFGSVLAQDLLDSVVEGPEGDSIFELYADAEDTPPADLVSKEMEPDADNADQEAYAEMALLDTEMDL